MREDPRQLKLREVAFPTAKPREVGVPVSGEDDDDSNDPPLGA